jgi:N-methylhydantoinase B
MLRKEKSIPENTGRICDPITLEIVRGVLKATMQEINALIERTAMSAFIREKKDFQSGIYDKNGRLVYSYSWAASSNLVQTVLDIFPADSMKDGDLYWYNDCYASKGVVTHSPDQVFLMPVFGGGEIIAYVEGWAHFNDIGGMRSGSISSDCTEIFQEGIIVPPVKLVDQGRIVDDLLRLFCRNSRFPEMVLGDMRALMAATGLGKRRIEEAHARFGAERLGDAFNQIIEHTAVQARSKMESLFVPGVYKTSATIDSDGQGNGPFQLRYTLSVGKDRIDLDTTESDNQTKGPVNLLLNRGSTCTMLGDYILSSDGHSVSNAGLLAVLDDIKIRKGSILQPIFPAPLGFRGSTMMRHLVALTALVAIASQGQSNAGFSSYVIYYMRGRDQTGHNFLLSDGIGVGYGARPYADGNDAIYGTANENYPCEFVELNYPVRVRRYGINQDTGGAGRYRGGCGVIRELEVLAETAVVSMRIDSIKTPPWGVNGGMAGRSGGCWLNPGTAEERYVEGVSDGTVLKPGDILRVMSAGGGGWGHPFDREPERVLADVLDGFVSVGSAFADYGVVLDAAALTIDPEATAKRRADRPAVKLFHQNGYKEMLA